MSANHTNAEEPPHTATHNGTDLPPAWKCDEPYRYSLPPAEDDPWPKMLKPLMDADKAKCSAWTDEVQNLLLFAGLFSAVVTGFAVESYKGLQPDPSVLLLAQIAAATSGNVPANNTGIIGSLASPDAFAASPSTIRLNIFLFTSLMLSLATALIGIVALQWLREHRHADESFTPETAFAMLHMRTEALNEWHVPELFSALPLLLQTALILFLAGMVELLIDSGHNVIVPVGAVIGLTILFLVLTTILPTLQTLTTCQPNHRSKRNVPVPCPYKSPQSGAFRRLMTSSKFGILSVSIVLTLGDMFLGAFGLLQRVILKAVVPSIPDLAIARSASLENGIRSIMESLHRHVQNHLGGGGTYNRNNVMREQFDFHLTCRTWPEVDLSWMNIRDNYFQTTQPAASWLFTERQHHTYYTGLYDLTVGVYREMLRETFSIDAEFRPPNFLGYHCMFSLAFPEQSTVDKNPGPFTFTESIIRRNQFLGAILQHKNRSYSPLRIIKNIYSEATIDIIRDEDHFMALHFFEYRLREVRMPVPSKVYKALAEVYYRLLGYLYTNPREMATDPDIPVAAVLVPFNAELLWRMDIYGDADQQFTFQWAKTIHLFFEALSQSNHRYDTFARSFHAHPFFREFCYFFWRQLDWEIRNKRTLPASISVLQAIATLQLITKFLDGRSQGSPHIGAFRVCAASIYVQFSRRFPSVCNLEPLSAVEQPLLPLLQRKLTEVKATKLDENAAYPDPLKLFGAGEVDSGKMELFSDDWCRVLDIQLSPLGA